MPKRQGEKTPGWNSNMRANELIQRRKDSAEERGSMLEDNRDEDDQDH